MFSAYCLLKAKRSPLFTPSDALIFRIKKKISIWILRPLELSGLAIANDLPEITQTADLAKSILDLDTRQDRQKGKDFARGGGELEGKRKKKKHCRGAQISPSPLPIQQTPG